MGSTHNALKVHPWTDPAVGLSVGGVGGDDIPGAMTRQRIKSKGAAEETRGRFGGCGEGAGGGGLVINELEDGDDEVTLSVYSTIRIQYYPYLIKFHDANPTTPPRDLGNEATSPATNSPDTQPHRLALTRPGTVDAHHIDGVKGASHRAPGRFSSHRRGPRRQRRRWRPGGIGRGL